ncbi:MAG TPA: MoaD/ThiS family protein [Conexivisphaerales archaeon]|nr:MoaD/ThiS family protein [Conexivisphaerales archaeon]
MAISVKLYGRIRDYLNAPEIVIEEDVRTVEDLVDILNARSGNKLSEFFFDPGTREIRPSFVMLVNGHSIRLLQGLKTKLYGNSDIVIDNIDIMETEGGG